MANRFLNNITINDEYTLPSVDGDADQIIKTDGTGSLSFVDLSSIEGASSNFVYFEVKNETGSTINKGKGVMAVGTDGNSGHILIDEMIADGSVEPKYFLGVLEENIANGGFAKVISFGQLDQFNTNGQNGETWADGNILWCDPDSAGDFTITEPDGPNVKIAAAIVLNASTNGKIQVRVQANEGIHDLHDTKITSQVDGDVLVWDNTTGVWFNDSTLNVDYTAGNVGIGTTSPSAKLEVNGTINVNNSGDSIFIADGSNGTFTLGDIDGVSSEAQISGDGVDITLSNDGSATLTTTANNRVGIGTAAPASTFHVYENSAVTNSNAGITIENDGTGDAVLQFLLSGASRWVMGIDNSDSNKFKLSATQDVGVSSLVTVQTNGHVGIGTTTPSSKLQSVTSSSGPADYTQRAAILGHNNSTDTVFANSVGVAGKISTSGGVAIYGDADNGGGWAGYFLGKGYFSGRVGIGTTSPGFDLDVTGNSGIRVSSPSDLPLRVESTDGFAAISLKDTTHEYYLATTSDDFRIRSATDGNTDRLTIQGTTGNVGIGTTSPIEKLEVNGNVRIATNDFTDKYLGFWSVDGTNNPRTWLKHASSATTQELEFNSAFSTGSGYSKFLFKAGTTDLLTIRPGSGVFIPNGDVGIGTTTPDSLLNVEGSKNEAILTLGSNYNGSAWAVGDRVGGIDFYSADGSGAGNGVKASISYEVSAGTTGSTNVLTFNTAGTSAGTNNVERMRITSAGNVGIGATTPDSKLQVDGGIQMADDTDAASASKVGTLRYRTSGNNSYVDMCMQTGASTYAWVNIVQNNW